MPSPSRKTSEESRRDERVRPDRQQGRGYRPCAALAAALGPDRAADFMEVQEHGIDKTARLFARLDLPPRTYGTVRNIQQDVTQRAAALRADPQLSAADRATQLANLAATARTQLTATLGDR